MDMWVGKRTWAELNLHKDATDSHLSGPTNMIRATTFLGIFLAISGLCRAQSIYFPPKTGSTWATTSPSSLGWCLPEIDSLYDFLDKGDTKAFIVLKDGKMVLEKYFDNFVQDSVWYWASAGKTLTGFAVGLAAQEGFLKLTDTSSKYLGTGWSNLTPQQEAKITVWHHLTMTTGLDDAAGDPDCTDKNCLVYKADPGTRWAYHNAPYTLLDKVIQGATGQNINNFITPRIKNTTGLTGIYFPTGYNNVYFSTARSMARFGLLMLNRGVWDTTKILKDTQYFRDMINSSQQMNLSYGYLTWLNGKASYMVPGAQLVIPGMMMPDAPADMFCALGKNSQYINVVPSKGIVLVRMGNTPPQGGGLVPTTFDNNIWKYMNRVMCNNSGVEDEELSEMLIYPNPAGDVLHIRSQELPEKIGLYSLSGKLIFAAEYTNKIDLNGVKSGLYITEVVVNGNAYREKVLIR